MRVDFLSNRAASDLLGMPAFIRADQVGGPGKILRARDYWAPVRTGSDHYQRGVGYFADARAFALAIATPGFIAFVVNAMIGRPVSDLELGFLEALASKAVCGNSRDSIPDDEIRSLLAACSFSLHDTTYGESEAHLSIDAARFCGTPEIVLEDLLSLIQHGPTSWSTTFLWTICRAAYAGGAN